MHFRYASLPLGLVFWHLTKPRLLESTLLLSSKNKVSHELEYLDLDKRETSGEILNLESWLDLFVIKPFMWIFSLPQECVGFG